MNAPKPFHKTGKPGSFGWEPKGAYYEIYWAGERIPANLFCTHSPYVEEERHTECLGPFPTPEQAAEAAVEHERSRAKGGE